MKSREERYLRELAACEEGKGLLVTKGEKRIVSALVRKGYAFTLASVFEVAIITDEGRQALRALSHKEAQGEGS